MSSAPPPGAADGSDRPDTPGSEGVAVVAATRDAIPFDRLVRQVPRSGTRRSVLLRHPWWTVLVLAAAGLIARLIGLGGGLWIDEIYSLLDSFRPPLATVLTEFPGDTQHPLYSVLANLSRSLLGESAWSIRLPAVVFGVASIPLLYVLGERVAGARHGLLASALLAFSYHHVWFSQNARGYTMLAFWAILSTYLLYRGLREGGRRRFLQYGLVIGLGVFTHLTMAFLVAAQALVAMVWTLRHRGEEGVGRSSDALLGLAVGVVTGALLYAPVFTQVVDFFLNQPSRLEGVSTPTWALLEALRVLRIGTGAWIGLLAGALVFGLGLWRYARRDALALALFVLPGVVTLGGALLARGTMYPRFYFFLIGFAFLIAVQGALVLGEYVTSRVGGGRLSERSLAVGTAFVIAMIVVSAASLRANYAAPKQDFGAALTYVEATAGAADVIATVGVTTLPYERFYGRSFAEITGADSLEELRAGGGRVWVLYTFERYIDAFDQELARVLRTDCETSRVFPATVGGGAITVCSFDATGSYQGEGVQ